MRLNHEVCEAHLNEVPTDFAGKTVLDVACGHENPFFAERLRLAKYVIGLDGDPREISKNVAIHEGHVGDIHAMPLASGSVDVVVSVDTIEHSVEPDLFLKECHRVLRAGGEAVFATPNYWVIRMRLQGSAASVYLISSGELLIIGCSSMRPVISEHVRNVSQKGSENGISIIAISYVPEISWFLSVYPIAFTLAHAYNRVTGALGLERLWGYMVVRLQKV